MQYHVQLSPPNVPIDDIAAAATQSHDIPFLLREVRGRVRNFTIRTQHLEQLQHHYLVDYNTTTQTLTLTFRVGVVATFKLTVDYPQSYAPVRVERLDGVNGWSQKDLNVIKVRTNYLWLLHLSYLL